MTTNSSVSTVENLRFNSNHHCSIIRPALFNCTSPSATAPNREPRFCVQIVTKYAPPVCNGSPSNGSRGGGLFQCRISCNPILTCPAVNEEVQELRRFLQRPSALVKIFLSPAHVRV